MKRKIYMLIIVALFLLIMPLQFGCDKAEDETHPQQIEEQVVADEQEFVDLPLLPETDPFGNPIDPAAINNSENTKGGVLIDGVVLTDGSLFNNDLDSWDTECENWIQLSHTSYSNFYTLHYYKRNSGSWICSGWKFHEYSGYSNGYDVSYTWDVSFHKDDVIKSYAYTWKAGVYNGKWGTTYTIADPPEASNSFGEFVLDEALSYIVGGIVSGFGIPISQIAGWFSGWGIYTDVATVLVVDQDGNPLHASVGFPFHVDQTFLGSVVRDDADGSLSTVYIKCHEPDGPESYDDNLLNRTATVYLSAYDNEAYWGAGDDQHMPVITVTFNTNTTTTVDYPGTSECIDADGQVYQTVTIGTQTWMAENLNYDCSGSWCYDDNPDNGNTYGRLYTWYAAKTAAPPGWHLPTDAEWTTLTNYLESSAGGKMKETGTAHWDSPNTGATNESGFTALPSGRRYYEGTFSLLCRNTTFWSATEYDNNRVWNRILSYSSSDEFRSRSYKTDAVSVRCVKN
ncbi:MAG: fibrobacter succinogenes major paralogous domain-containing protein [Bacteroidales bacterium]|nr:fibrobacter succinogenes major paralogous domain-containing protein [Bacteroidales bacterium]